jgi:hypothetical protein
LLQVLYSPFGSSSVIRAGLACHARHRGTILPLTGPGRAHRKNEQPSASRLCGFAARKLPIPMFYRPVASDLRSALLREWPRLGQGLSQTSKRLRVKNNLGARLQAMLSPCSRRYSIFGPRRKRKVLSNQRLRAWQLLANRGWPGQQRNSLYRHETPLIAAPALVLSLDASF